MKNKFRTEFIEKARNDFILNYARNHAQQNGLNENEMLTNLVLVLLKLKDDAYQEKLDKILSSPSPALFDRYLEQT